MDDDVDAFARRCPSCGNDNRRNARFCDGCGLPILGTAPADAPAPPQAGELKYASVLFADIVGSTAMVADCSPDAARERLLPAMTAMIDAVEAFGGTVNQRIGDGVMALFGIPVSQEDHALRACCAAMRMHDVAQRLPSPAGLRVGIASGLALMAGRGIGAEGTYAAFGASIHLASRLQALAPPGGTVLDESTAALAGGGVRASPVGLHHLRGFATPQPVFTLTGLEPEGRRFSHAIARDLSPLVGRAEELARLLGLAAGVHAGAPQRVALFGEAGSGKSRLAWELATRLRGGGWQFVAADAISYGRDIPFQLAGRLLCSVFGIADRGDAAAAGRIVRARLAEAGQPGLSTPLLSVLDLPLGADGPAWDALQPLARRRAIDAAVSGVFDALFAAGPLLVLVEDLQWADDESLRLIDLMLRSRGRVLMLGTERPRLDGAPPLWPDRWAERIELPRLDLDGMIKLLLHGFPAITDPECQLRLIGRAAGNPFFLEELARATLASGAAEAVPPTVQAVIAARIDRLDPAVKALLVTASAFGTRIPARLLPVIAGEPRTLRARLAALVEADLLQPIGSDDPEISFNHALVQEVAYAGLPAAESREIHGRIVRAIGRVESGRLAEMAETVVYHATRAALWEELIPAADLAGVRAGQRSAFAESARFFGQAIEAFAHLRRTPERIRAEIDLRFSLRAAIFPTAAISRSLANSLVAERLARSVEDRTRLGWATAYVAKDYQLAGRPGDALRTAERAAALAGSDERLQVAALYFGAQAHYSRGNYAETVATMRDVIGRLDGLGAETAIGTPGPTSFFCNIWLAWAEARLGQFEAARETAAVMHRWAERADAPLFRMLACLSEGFALTIERRFDLAEPVLRRAMGMCQRWELFGWFMNIAAALGHVLSQFALHDEAIELLSEAVTRTRNSGILVGHAHELAWQSAAFRRAGHVTAAEQCAREAIDQAVAAEERGNQALALLQLGEAIGAPAPIYEAMSLAQACGMVPLLDECARALRSLRAAPFRDWATI